MYRPFSWCQCFPAFNLLLPIASSFNYFQTGKGETQYNIDIQSCHKAISVKHAQAILGFHVLTSCDQIGQFSGKTKLFLWKSFFKADKNILKALSPLETDENLWDLVTLSKLERFMVSTYGMCNNLIFIFLSLMKLWENIRFMKFLGGRFAHWKCFSLKRY